MLFDVAVVVNAAANDTDHDGQVGYRVDDGTTACTAGAGWKWSHIERFDTVTTQSWTLYNFQPGTAYQYKVRIGVGPYTTACGSLGTPSLPANLGYLTMNFAGSGSPATPYIVMDTGDCGGGGTGGGGARDYLVAIDTAAHTIVWYLDIAAIGTIGGTMNDGWVFLPSPGTPILGRFLSTVDKRYLYEWDWTGLVIDSKDYGTACDGTSGAAGPCISHDVNRSPDTGATYVVTSQQSTVSATGTDWDSFAECSSSRFINDGYEQFAGAFSTLTSDNYLMTDYGHAPATDPGPRTPAKEHCHSSYWEDNFDSTYDPLDWTHGNSVAAHKPGSDDLLDLSYKEWSQVIRVNATTGTKLWSLSGTAAYSTLTLGIAGGITGAVGFTGQHAVYTEGGKLYMLDNEGDTGGMARVLEITLSGGPPVTTATITKSWALVDTSLATLACQGLGSGIVVPGTSAGRVLALCNHERTVEELSDSDGVTSATPPLVISLPTTDFCSLYGPTLRKEIWGWYRAFPVTNIGEF